MNRRWICSTALIGLFAPLCGTGCGAGLRPASQSARDDWYRMVAKLPRDPQKAATLVNAYQKDHGVVLEMWADSTTDTAKYELEDAPCGPMAFAFVQRLSADTRDGLSGDMAVEIDSQGHELRQWPIDANDVVEAVGGDRVFTSLIRRSDSLRVDLAVDSRGNIEAVPPPQNDSAEQVPCPAVATFAGSSYLACFKVRDVVTHQVRLFAWQLLCT